MTLGRRNAKLLLYTALYLVCTVATSSAQSTNETQLETIVVKGKRVVPASTASDTLLATQTSADEIRKNEIRNIRDLGNTTEPGVDFVENKPGKTGGLFIRGLSGARVVTLVDGIPIPYYDNGTRGGTAQTTTSDSNSSFDFSALSSVDVLRGSDSSRIGPGALGGALVTKTLEPSDLISDNKDWGGIAKVGYDTSDKSFSSSVGVAKRIDRTSVLFQGSLARGHETRNMGEVDSIGNLRTKPNPAETTQTNLLFKLRHDLAGGHNIGFTAERFERKLDSDLKTLQSSVASATNFKIREYDGFDDTRRERLSFDYKYEADSDESVVGSADAAIYWQRMVKAAGSEGLRYDNARHARDNAYRESSFGVNVSAGTSANINGTAQEFRYGGSLQFIDASQYTFLVPSSTHAQSQADSPDVKGIRFGAYIDDTISVTEEFKLTPGLRFDWHYYKPQRTGAFMSNPGLQTPPGQTSPIFDFPSANSDNQFSPKLLASYQLTPAWEFFGQWSMAYRAPTIHEAFGNFTNFASGYANLGNSDLKPEIGQTFEIGANFEGDDLRGRLSVFHSKYKDFIDQFGEETSLFQYNSSFVPGVVDNKNGQIFTYGNRSNVRISGVELQAQKDFTNGFFVKGSAAYSYGKDTETGEFLRTLAPFKSVLGIGYDQETWGAELTGIFSARMRQSASYVTRGQSGNVTVKDFDAPGYGIFNLTGWWEPEQTKGLRIQAGVYNLFDKTYYNAVGVRNVNVLAQSTSNQPVAFYSEPGRTFKISLTQKF